MWRKNMNAQVQNELLNNKETARLLGITHGTLEVWRHQGKGPTFIKMGQGKQAPIRYLRSTVMEWLQNQCYSSTSAYSAPTHTK